MEEQENAVHSIDDIYQSLDSLNSTTVATNNAIRELTEYLITKDKNDQQKEATEKKQAEEKAKEDAEIAEQEQKEKDSVQAEENAIKEAKEDANQATVESVLADIKSEMQLNNQIFAGQILFTGILAGVLIFSILWNRLKND